MPRSANSALATLLVLQDLRQDIDNALARNERKNKQLSDALKNAPKQMDSFLKQCFTMKSKVQSFETEMEQKLKHFNSLQNLNKPPKEFTPSKHSLYIDLSRSQSSTRMAKNLASTHRLDADTVKIQPQLVATVQQSKLAVHETSSIPIPDSTRVWRVSLASLGDSQDYCVPSILQPALGGSSETSGPSKTTGKSPGSVVRNRRMRALSEGARHIKHDSESHPSSCTKRFTSFASKRNSREWAGIFLDDFDADTKNQERGIYLEPSLSSQALSERILVLQKRRQRHCVCRAINVQYMNQNRTSAAKPER